MRNLNASHFHGGGAAFAATAALLLVVHAALLLTTSRLESQTWDEAIHISAGLSYWRTGDYRLNVEHPALPKLLCSAPLLLTSASLPLADESWKQRDQVTFARKFLYENVLPPERILLVTRSVTMLVSVGLGIAIALWTRHRFGNTAAFLALALYVFDPNILAHSRYVTTDMWVTAFGFFACVAFYEALARRTIRWYLLAGAAVGLAIGSKFSALYLVPVLAGFVLLRRPRVLGLATAAATAAVTLAIPYTPEIRSTVVARSTRTAIQEPVLSVPLAATADNGTFIGKRLHHIGKALDLPSFSYLYGLASVAEHVKGGHWAYLLGEASQEGWWYYFPVAFAVKTPLALLLATAMACALVLWKRPRPRKEVLILAIPFAAWWGFAMYSRLNIGLRHLLPVYPFLFVLVAVALARYTPRVVWGAVVLLVAVESFAIYPHYLAFFNAAAGGPSRGPEYLLDSNIDWGQDAYKLREWVNRHAPGAQVCASYFGQAYPSLIGIREAYLPRYNELQQQQEMDCIAAASVTLLYSGYSKDDDLRHLRRLQPIGHIGYSIYLYDFRKRP